MRMLSAVAGLVLAFSGVVAQAADSFSEGNGYSTLEQQVRPADSSRIEVNEVFSYACPHCFHFEPLLAAWAKKQAADVNLVQTHASFNRPDWTAYQRGYYTVLSLGIKDKVQEAVFNSIHVAHKELTTVETWADFLSIYGVDKQKTTSMYNSFGVNSQIKQAEAKVRDFKVTSTPQLIIDGRFRVTAKSHEDMLKVTDFLIAKIRAERAALKK